MDRHTPRSSLNSEAHSQHVVAITGGRVNVGKSTIALNLAVALGRLGEEVTLVDGEFNGHGAIAMTGQEVRHTFWQALANELPVDDVLIPGPENIRLLAAEPELHRLHAVAFDTQLNKIKKFWQAIAADSNWLILDVPSVAVRRMPKIQTLIAVITPELATQREAAQQLQALQKLGINRRVEVIVNKVAPGERSNQIFSRFQEEVSAELGLTCNYLGSVWMDESIRASALSSKPVATLPTQDPSCKSFMRLAEALIAAQASPASSKKVSPLPLPSGRPKLVARANHDTDEREELPLIPRELSYPLLSQLLERISADDLSPEERQQIQHQFNDKFGEPEPDLPPAPTPPAAIKLTPTPPSSSPPISSSAESPDLITIEPAPAVPAAKTKATNRLPQWHSSYYDERRFGNQNALLAQIVALPDSDSLTEFLAAF
ncbi:MinD/ParA family protein [Halioxenophilus sp. WMMB6]|uniref:MinD/ParA family ATP-binding protein n=1 Tax=Halioxenophilus sp. WMMB6 TaxID=3073815 RepID=UPI00295E2716|nr:P-loop NTPase [Halioxenophilus sp. WMMB6]